LRYARYSNGDLKDTKALMPKKPPPIDDRRMGGRIREARKAREMTMVELAEAIGVTQPAISQWESGQDPPGRESLQKLSKALGVPMSLLLGEAPALAANIARKERAAAVNAMSIDVPVQGVAVGGTNGDFRFNGQVVDYVRRPPGIANLRNVYALWILGDSMSPWNKDGDLIYVSPARPPAVGDHIVVQMHDAADGEPGIAMVKLLVGKTPTQLKLSQYNPQRDFTVPLAKIKSIHKVLSLRELLGT
jgi:phage repressor protein C with HTH and peptisase S24 domain